LELTQTLERDVINK